MFCIRKFLIKPQKNGNDIHYLLHHTWKLYFLFCSCLIWLVIGNGSCKNLRNSQSMLRRNWCTNINLHVYHRLHERLLLLLWNCSCDRRFVYLQCRASCCWSMSNISFSTKQDKAELYIRKVTVTSVAVATTKFLFGMCNCTVDSWQGWFFARAGDFARAWTRAHAIARVSVHGLTRFDRILRHTQSEDAKFVSYKKTYLNTAFSTEKFCLGYCCLL